MPLSEQEFQEWLEGVVHQLPNDATGRQIVGILTTIASNYAHADLDHTIVLLQTAAQVVQDEDFVITPVGRQH